MIERLLERLSGRRLDELFVPVGLEPGPTPGPVPRPAAAFLRVRDSYLRATRAHAVASLVPLRLALFPGALPGVPARLAPAEELVLSLHEVPASGAASSSAADGDRELGRVGLRFEREVILAGEPVWLLSVTGVKDWGQPLLGQAVRRLALALRAVRSQAPLRVAASTTEALAVLYCLPRPVHLIGCAEGTAWDLFPMDLVGDPGQGRVTLALRKTSPANPVLERTRRVALAAASLLHVGLAYRQGRSHPLLAPDTELGLPLCRSRLFGLRVPCDALGVREVQLDDSLDLDSHTLFMGRVVGVEEPPARQEGEAGLALHHVQAAYGERAALRRPTPA